VAFGEMSKQVMNRNARIVVKITTNSGMLLEPHTGVWLDVKRSLRMGDDRRSFAARKRASKWNTVIGWVNNNSKLFAYSIATQ
jgi:hypothetical protein